MTWRCPSGRARFFLALVSLAVSIPRLQAAPPDAQASSAAAAQPAGFSLGPRPAPCPPRWAGLLGHYGAAHDGLWIRERDRALEAGALSRFHRLEEVGTGRFRFPRVGGRAARELRFLRDAGGRVRGLLLDGALLPPARTGVRDAVFRITPVRPLEDLRREARAATAPDEAGLFRPSELVELTTLDSTIRLDVRYATTANFLGAPVYESARAYLQRPAAAALLRAHRHLRTAGYGLLIHDAYRPWWVTKLFWDATPADKRAFVADPQQGSRHNRGCAVDLTLYHLADGLPVEMPSVYDEMSERAHPDFPGGSSEERWHRALLREALEAEGFSVFAAEWWHFDHRDWRQFALHNVSFEELAARR